jgi:hypothetical protein
VPEITSISEWKSLGGENVANSLPYFRLKPISKIALEGARLSQFAEKIFLVLALNLQGLKPS